MTFHEVVFPTSVDFGTQGGPGFETHVLVMDSGHETRVARRAQGRHTYRVSFNVHDYESLADVRNFFFARGGAKAGFRFLDPFDYDTTEQGNDLNDPGHATSPTDQVFGTGDGSTTQFQLVKRYSDDGGTHVRTIRKPIEATVEVAIDGVEATSGWSVDDTTGVVTFDTAPAVGEVLTWGGQFHVPVRFSEDTDRALQLQADDAGSGSIPSLVLEEILAESPIGDEDMHYGGAIAREISATTTLNWRALLWHITPDANNLKLLLPNLTGVPTGGPIFVVHNASGSHSLLLRTHSDGAVATIAAGATVRVYCFVNDSAGTKEWAVA